MRLTAAADTLSSAAAAAKLPHLAAESNALRPLRCGRRRTASIRKSYAEGKITLLSRQAQTGHRSTRREARMSATLMLGLASTMVATSFLSGIFGMAGGLILMGVLLALLPLPEAMALHAVTQMASNGLRSLLWVRYVRWRAAAAFLVGCALAFVVWTQWRYVPSKPVAFILL